MRSTIHAKPPADYGPIPGPTGLAAFLGGWSEANRAAEFERPSRDGVMDAVQPANAEEPLCQLRFARPQFPPLDPQDLAKILAEQPNRYEQIDEGITAHARGARSPEERPALPEWEGISTQVAEECGRAIKKDTLSAVQALPGKNST